MRKAITSVTTRIKLHRNRARAHRRLEIGPGRKRLPGFETLSILPGNNIDYVWDAARRLPFSDDTFELIYASHVLEHIPWYQTVRVLEDWVRVLRAGGRLEIWVPDGLKICKTLVDFELDGTNDIDRDGWYRFNEEKDPCKWAAGRLFTYGDGDGNPFSPNWHRAIFTPRYLKTVLEQAGVQEITQLDRSQVRGQDHGWINLGMSGYK